MLVAEKRKKVEIFKAKVWVNTLSTNDKKWLIANHDLGITGYMFSVLDAYGDIVIPSYTYMGSHNLYLELSPNKTYNITIVY